MVPPIHSRNRPVDTNKLIGFKFGVQPILLLACFLFFRSEDENDLSLFWISSES